MKKIFLLCLISLIPNLGSTTAMSEEKSRCLGKEATARTYQAWKTDFHRFLSGYETSSEKDKFEISKGALRKITSLTKTFSLDTGVQAPEAMIADATRLLNDPNMGSHLKTRQLNS